MDNTLVVQVFERLDQLVNVVSGFSFSIALLTLCFQILIEFTSWSVLENQINFLVIPEEAIHAKNILMTEVRLNLNFSPELVLNIRFEKLLFIKNFEGNYKLRLLLSRQVDMSELASAKWFSNFKVVNRPFYSRFLLFLVVFFLNWSLIFKLKLFFILWTKVLRLRELIVCLVLLKVRRKHFKGLIGDCLLVVIRSTHVLNSVLLQLGMWLLKCVLVWILPFVSVVSFWSLWTLSLSLAVLILVRVACTVSKGRSLRVVGCLSLLAYRRLFWVH